LPEKYRLPVLLCYLGGKSHTEAAQLLRWPVGTVKGRLTRARARLRDRLARRGVTLAGATLAAVLPANAAGAAVPPVLAASTVQAALAFATGKAAVGPQVAALAEEGLRALPTPPVKLGAALLLALSILVAGVGLAARQILTADPPDATPAGGLQPPRPPLDPPQPAGEKRARTDRYGDLLPPGALARLGTVRFRHTGEVTAIAFAPDSKAVASAGGKGIHLWEVATGRELRQFQGHPAGAGACSLAFSPDGKTLAAPAYGKPIVLWDMATGKELRQFAGHHNTVFAVAFSPDGKTLASAGWDRTVRLWDVATGKETRRLQGHRDMVWAVAFSPDGKLLASGSWDTTAILWEVATGKELRRWQGHEGGRFAVAFSPDGKLLAAAGSKENLFLREVATGRELRQFQQGQGIGGTFAFAPDGKVLAAVRSDGTLGLWEVATGKELRRFWKLPGWLARSGGNYPLAFSPDGKLVADRGLDPKVLRLWDVATGKEHRPAEGHTGAVASVAISPDGRTVASSSEWEDRIRLWEAATGKPLHSWPGTVRSVLAFSPDGRSVAAASYDGQVRLWDVSTGKELRRLQAGGDWRLQNFHSLAFAPHGRILAAGSGKGQICVWDVAGGKLLRQILAHRNDPEEDPGTISSLVFSQDGKLLVSACDNEWPFFAWDVATGKRVRTFQGPATAKRVGVLALSFSPSGKSLISLHWAHQGARVRMRLWEVATGRVRRELEAPFQQLAGVAFSPGGEVLALGVPGDTAIHFWDPSTGQKLGRLPGHPCRISALAFAPGGHRLVSGSEDTTVLVWEGIPRGKGR
jgi:WD40 repeat protein